MALVEECRSLFVDGVCCELPGFLRPEAVDSMVEAVEARRDRAYLSSRHRNAYSAYAPIHDDAPVPFEENDPRAVLHRRHCHYLAYDEFDADLALPVMYQAQAVLPRSPLGYSVCRFCIRLTIR